MFNVLMFYSICAAGVMASLLRSPVYAFVLYEVVYFFNPKYRWWGASVPDISYSFFIVLLMMALLLFNRRQLINNSVLKVPQLRWMFLLVSLYCIAYFYAISPTSHLEAAIVFVKLAIIIAIAYKLCDTNEKLNYALYGYIFGAWYVGFLAFQVGRNAGDRLEGIGTVDAPDANDIAAAIAPAIVFCIYFFWTSKKWWIKCLMAITGVFIANGLVLINSRGAFLGASASILYFMLYMYFSSFQRRFQKGMAVFIAVAGLAGAAVIVDASFIERMKTMSNTEVQEEQESGATRTAFWLAAWEMAKDHPFGAGLLGFNYYAPQYIPGEIDTGSSRHRTVHSSWFEALTEVGYLGMLAFIMMIYSTFKTLNLCKKALYKENRVDDYFKVVAIQAGFIAFIISMTFINRMRAEVLYWSILYSACAYNIYVLKAQLKDSSNRVKPHNLLSKKNDAL